ncbi:MAG: hypothetical protein DHS20C09_22340 [marine bacterium B5-7]|nr:MAG: hypothetical protein DHS20C09_22340 [marine bacterium B5-7]
MLINKITQYFWKIENKIAFYPSLIAIWGVVFALLMVSAEQYGISEYLQDAMPVLVINDLATARVILSSLIGGLVSILVFSFSMVMIILNQASSNFSPRLLPGLISNKKHQSILGIHLSGIFYCLITLISIEPTDENYQLPGFSVLVAIFFITVSLAAFIYFIHSISQSIQVEYILKSIFKSAKQRLLDLIELDDKYQIRKADNQAFSNTDDWHEYYMAQSGYIQTIHTNNLLKLTVDENTLIQVLPTKNTFLLEGLPIFKSKAKLDEKLVQTFMDQFLIDNVESMDENYAMAFQLITEIGIKAMSPGINDPGTALTCIDYLTELLAMRIKKSDQMLISENDQVKIEIKIISFKQLLYVILAPFRAYCSHDIIIVTKLLSMCEYLLMQECINESYHQSIRQEANEIINDAREKLHNQQDINVLDSQLAKFK